MNPKWRTFWTVAGCFLAGALIQVFLDFFAALMGGAGHGTFFFADALNAPEPLMMWFWLWPVLGALFALRTEVWARNLAMGLLVVHYCGIVMTLFFPGDGAVRPFNNHAFSSGPGIFLIALFLLLQVAFWIGITSPRRSLRRRYA